MALSHRPDSPLRRLCDGMQFRMTVPALAIAIFLAFSPAGIAQLSIFGNKGESTASDKFASTTSDTAKSQAIKSVPWQDLTPQAQAKAYACVTKHTAYRRLPIRVIQCDSQLYWFLVNHPDVIVNIWETLGITQLSLSEQEGGTFELIDRAGTEGTVEFLHRDTRKLLVYTEGTYDGPLFAKTLNGRSLMILTSHYLQGRDGKHYITCQADCFVKIDNVGADLIARLLHPLVGHVVDNNFIQAIGFAGDLSLTAEVDPIGTQSLASQLKGIRPELRDEFKQLCRQVSDRAIARNNASKEHMVAQNAGITSSTGRPVAASQSPYSHPNFTKPTYSEPTYSEPTHSQQTGAPQPTAFTVSKIGMPNDLRINTPVYSAPAAPQKATAPPVATTSSPTSEDNTTAPIAKPNLREPPRLIIPSANSSSQSATQADSGLYFKQ